MGLISRVSSRTYRNVNFVKTTTKMVSVKDANQSDFVTAFAAFLKKSGKCTPPKWSDFAKTATFKQMPPADDDWFYVRTAAIARQLYFKGNGHIARLAFQQLESMKLVEKADKGRKLSKEGQRDMDRVAATLVKSN